MISDPVRGNVSEADVSGEAGPLPKAPEPAQIEVFTNFSAGQAVATPVRTISTGIVDAVSMATSERLSSAAAEQGAQLTPEVAAVIGDPVRADVTEAQPVRPDSGNGQSPFFLAFLVNLSGLIGGAVIYFLAGAAAERMEGLGLRSSRTGLWTAPARASPRFAHSRGRAVGRVRPSWRRARRRCTCSSSSPRRLPCP